MYMYTHTITWTHLQNDTTALTSKKIYFLEQTTQILVNIWAYIPIFEIRVQEQRERRGKVTQPPVFFRIVWQLMQYERFHLIKRRPSSPKRGKET